jgi:cytoskeletal protein RodZ
VAEKTHAESPSLESLGQILAREREKAGLTRNDLASTTRIAIDQIAKMEEGQFSHLPPVYARGFLKTLAGAMGLDQEVFLGEYRRLSGHKEEFPSRPLRNNYVETDIFDESGSGLGLSILIIIIVLGVVVALFFLNPTFHRFIAQRLPFLSEESVPATPVAPPTTPVVAAPSPAPAPRPGGRLVLRAVKATWTQVQVDEGGLRFVYFQPGQSQSFDSDRSIKVIVGDGQALTAEWNGQDLGFLGPQGPRELAFPPAR